jgi:hypothetical protein
MEITVIAIPTVFGLPFFFGSLLTIMFVRLSHLDRNLKVSEYAGLKCRKQNCRIIYYFLENKTMDYSSFVVAVM